MSLVAQSPRANFGLLGLGAVVMQYAFWLALLICGTLIITATLSNIGDIFDI